MTSTETWKNLERVAAKKLGGKRIVRGNDFGESDLDVAHDVFACDAKYRAKWSFIVMFDKLIKDRDRLYPGKIPILVVKAKGRKGEFVILDLDDFCQVVKPEIIKGENIDGEGNTQGKQVNERA